MPSWQSYVVNLLLRQFVRRKLAKISTPAQARAAFSTPRLAKVDGVTFTVGREGNIPGEWAQNAQTSLNILLYLHGGGYMACSPAGYRPITGAFAQYGLAVFAPDYRLAPEHPFPAAVEDALAVYQALLTTYTPEQIIVAGDSAGGGLALGMVLAAREAGIPLPAGLILFSPWTDLAGTGASITRNAQRESLLVAERLPEVAALYLQGADAKTPTASPLYGDLANLPPMFIQVSDQEILLDDALRVAEKIKAAQGQVTLQVWSGLPHVWQFGQTFLPEARKALQQAADFANRTLASRAPRA